MTRDTLADAEYFTAKIAEEETSIAGIRERIPEMIEKRGARASSGANAVVHLQLVIASMAYSRGDPMEDVTEIVNSALSDLEDLHEFYRLFPDRMRAGRGGYWTALPRLSFATLFRLEPQVLDRVIYDVEFFNHTDPILQYMLAHLKGEPQPTGMVEQDLDFPEQFRDLWRILSLPQEAAQTALKSYVETWYDRNLPLGGDGAPGVGSHEKMIAYRGYWVWEAAAAAVVAGVDDSGIRDHPYYPSDAADWARERL